MAECRGQACGGGFQQLRPANSPSLALRAFQEGSNWGHRVAHAGRVARRVAHSLTDTNGAAFPHLEKPGAQATGGGIENHRQNMAECRGQACGGGFQQLRPANSPSLALRAFQEGSNWGHRVAHAGRVARRVAHSLTDTNGAAFPHLEKPGAQATGGGIENHRQNMAECRGQACGGGFQQLRPANSPSLALRAFQEGSNWGHRVAHAVMQARILRKS